jgi:murein tripeptide amidase MpaA
VLTLGSGPLKLWIISRQPGETMASWFMEGLLHRITDPPRSGVLRDATVYVVCQT